MRVLDIWSLTLHLEGLDNQSCSDYEDKDIGFKICQHRKIILFLQIKYITNLIVFICTFH